MYTAPTSKYLKFSISLWLLLPLLLSCCGPSLVKKDTHRTVLVYMVASNNLHSYAVENINTMKYHLDVNLMETGRLLVFYVPPYSDTQQLLEIKINTSTGQGDTSVLKLYNFENSLEISAMQQVISDTKRLASAKHYGMVLWSHAMGWHPYTSVLDSESKDVSTDLSPKRTREEDWLGWFGQDGYYYMEIPNLAKALEGQNLEFLLFDACFTASIEMLYDLRYSAEYLIGSPAEVMGAGYPYKDFVKLAFREDLNSDTLCRQLCQAFISAYRSNTAYPSASTVLVKLSEMDALAASARVIFESDPLPTSNIDLSAIQAYELMNPHLFYDLDDYMAAITRYPMHYNDFANQLARTVLYKDCTDQIYSIYDAVRWFNVTSYSGLSIYIPRYDLPYNQKINNLNQAYFQTAWAKATGQTAP